MSITEPMTMLLLGGAVRSANRGVSALGLACLANLREAFPRARLIAANNGIDTSVWIASAGGAFEVEASWICPSKSLRPRSGTRYLGILNRLRKWVPSRMLRRISNRTFDQLMDADVVLDISGGDSFAQIYGKWRFQSQVAVKQLALAMNKPLVLLPQTFGPFTTDRARRIAGRIIRRSALVVSRDLDGAEQLEQLAGREIRPRVASCPDVAFTLNPTEVATDRLPEVFRAERDGMIVGLNVSGFLYSGRPDMPLAADYRAVISAIVDWVMSIPNAKLLLAPHVFGKNGVSSNSALAPGDDASDLHACRFVQQQFASRFGDRIDCVTGAMGADELKYIIGHCDFFIGARMHSCIAAASQSIPTVVLAYSPKAKGVFGMINGESAVVDMTRTADGDVIDQIKTIYGRRDELAKHLQIQMPETKKAVRDFFCERLRSVLTGRAVDGQEDFNAALPDRSAHPAPSVVEP